MAKTCKSCGKTYTGEYCEHCGYGKEPQRAKAFDKYKSNRQIREEKQAAAAAAAKTGKKRITPAQIALIVGILAIVAGVIVWSLWRDGIIGAGDKTDPIVQYFESIAENDYQKYVSTMPDAIAQTYEDYISQYGLSKETFIKESYSDYHEILGESFTVQVNCGKEEELVAAAIVDAEDNFELSFGESIRIKEAYLVPTEVIFSGDVSTQTYYYDVYVARIGAHWYIIDIGDYYSGDE